MIPLDPGRSRPPADEGGRFWVAGGREEEGGGGRQLSEASLSRVKGWTQKYGRE